MLTQYNGKRGVVNTGICHKGVIKHHLEKCVLVVRAIRIKNDSRHLTKIEDNFLVSCFFVELFSLDECFNANKKIEAYKTYHQWIDQVIRLLVNQDKDRRLRRWVETA